MPTSAKPTILSNFILSYVIAIHYLTYLLTQYFAPKTPAWHYIDCDASFSQAYKCKQLQFLFSFVIPIYYLTFLLAPSFALKDPV